MGDFKEWGDPSKGGDDFEMGHGGGGGGGGEPDCWLGVGGGGGWNPFTDYDWLSKVLKW